MAAIIDVLELPPRNGLRTYVSFDSRYGTAMFTFLFFALASERSASWEITRPSVLRDKLIF
jgi:hypothetical protein